jgi:hypothetical protein
MEDTISGMTDERKEKIKNLEEIEHIARSVHPELAQAAQNFLAALRYHDKILEKSTETSVKEVFATIAQEAAQKEIDVSVQVMTKLQEGWRKTIDGVVQEDFDKIRRVCLSFIDERIANMTGLRDDLIVHLEEEGYQVKNSQELEQAINDLRQFRENLLKDWPDSDRPPAPINRQAIDEAKKSISQQEKWMTRKDLIHPKKTG